MAASWLLCRFSRSCLPGGLVPWRVLTRAGMVAALGSELQREASVASGQCWHRPFSPRVASRRHSLPRAATRVLGACAVVGSPPEG